MTHARCIVVAAAFAAGLFLFFDVGESPAQGAKGADAKTWNTVVDKAIAHLRKSQEKEGSWSQQRSPGCTGIVLTGLLLCGKVTPEDPMAQRALKYIEGLINVKAGHIAGRDDPKPQLLNYVTSINVMALQAAKRPDLYGKVVKDASNFLKKLQWDEGEGKTEKDDFFGGAGYDSKSRPDLSNTHFFLDALVAAGIPKDDPALKKALIFVSRCQNAKTEFNDQPWAGKIDDGSFIYSAAGGGVSKVEGSSPDKGLIGYGSMTYAGIKSMIYCGVDRKDVRVKRAFEWIQKSYALDRNPGMPDAYKERGLYYYYHTLAKTLDLMGVDEITTPDGKVHDWRAELVAEIARRQQPDGSWVNANDQWMEGDANLVTGYVLMALSHCKPKSR
jgi:squalene-hopene/tetraprenyl-beta-curcumene cyclase